MSVVGEVEDVGAFADHLKETPPRVPTVSSPVRRPRRTSKVLHLVRSCGIGEMRSRTSNLGARIWRVAACWG